MPAPISTPKTLRVSPVGTSSDSTAPDTTVCSPTTVIIVVSPIRVDGGADNLCMNTLEKLGAPGSVVDQLVVIMES
jgi:hypothetical protein